MEMKSKSFEEQLLYGRTFEDLFARWLISQGWFVTPKYLFCEEGAPLLIGKTSKYAIPDIDCAKEGKRLWVECKKKKRMFKHPATGYAEALHMCYKKVQEITGSEVFVVFEDATNGMEYYGNTINLLEKAVYKRHWFFDGREHITFRYPDAFKPMTISVG